MGFVVAINAAALSLSILEGDVLFGCMSAIALVVSLLVNHEMRRASL